jgi:hypothetical protein
MVKGELRLTIPNTQSQDIVMPLLARLLRRAGIAHEDWLGDSFHPGRPADRGTSWARRSKDIAGIAGGD